MVKLPLMTFKEIVPLLYTRISKKKYFFFKLYNHSHTRYYNINKQPTTKALNFVSRLLLNAKPNNCLVLHYHKDVEEGM